MELLVLDIDSGGRRPACDVTVDDSRIDLIHWPHVVYFEFYSVVNYDLFRLYVLTDVAFLETYERDDIVCQTGSGVATG